MGGRYFITGVQLAMLMNKDYDNENKLNVLRKIEGEQYIGNAETFDKMMKGKQDG